MSPRVLCAVTMVRLGVGQVHKLEHLRWAAYSRLLIQPKIIVAVVGLVEIRWRHIPGVAPTSRELVAGSCQPQPAKRVELPKPDGGVRELGIPTVVDRFSPAGPLAGAQSAVRTDLLAPELWMPAGKECAPSGGRGEGAGGGRTGMGRYWFSLNHPEVKLSLPQSRYGQLDQRPLPECAGKDSLGSYAA